MDRLAKLATGGRVPGHGCKIAEIAVLHQADVQGLEGRTDRSAQLEGAVPCLSSTMCGQTVECTGKQDSRLSSALRGVTLEAVGLCPKSAELAQALNGRP